MRCLTTTAYLNDMSYEERVFDMARSVHSFESDLIDKHCTICGEAAAHQVDEHSSVPFPPMKNYLCCEHFRFAIGDCSSYPYGMPLQRR